MDNINNYIIEKLNHLKALGENSKKNYAEAIHIVKNEMMKNAFLQFAKERALDVTELQSIIKSLGGNFKETTGIQGTSQIKGTDADSASTLVDQNMIINGCVMCEEAAMNAYNEALTSNKIFGSIRDILTYQLNSINNALKNIRTYSRKASFENWGKSIIEQQKEDKKAAKVNRNAIY
jgi:uncharacterized protein (TIGR02284 family)